MNNTEDIRNLLVEVLNNQGSDKKPDWLLGSGFFVGKNLVLTAFHNVQGAGELFVRCIPHGVEKFPAKVLLQGNQNIDLAVLEISNMEVDVPALRYGAVDQKRAPALVAPCWAIGFPRFKEIMYENEPLRDCAQVEGKIPTGDYLKSASLKQPLLTLRVDSTPEKPLPIEGQKIHESEWAGISGATVFLGNKVSNSIIIGVITEHHPREGSNSLTVVPITAIDDLLPSTEAAKWWQLLGVDNHRALVRLPDEEPSSLSYHEWYKLQTLLTDKTRGFVGRQHVFEKIEKFLKNQDSGYLIIEGDPGIGKSSILAEYVRRTGCIAHFNVRGQGIVRASQFLENVCSQLIVNYGLPYHSLPAKATQDGAVLGKLLQEASERLQPEEQLMIAVDALDEIDPNAQLGCSNCLCLPSRLPNGVYFVMTKRPRIDYVRLDAAPQEPLDLMLFPAENRSDVEKYIVRRAEHPKVRSWIGQQKTPTVDAFVKGLAELSKDNFMYLSYVLGDIENGKYWDLSIEKLPKGLEDYYDDHWKRMGMTTHSLSELKLKIVIVYILSEAGEPLPLKMIFDILEYNKYKANPIQIQSILNDWGQFLHEQQTSEGKLYSIYHTSFRDFLNRQDIVQAAGMKTIKEVRKLIAQAWLKKLRKGKDVL